MYLASFVPPFLSALIGFLPLSTSVYMCGPLSLSCLSAFVYAPSLVGHHRRAVDDRADQGQVLCAIRVHGVHRTKIAADVAALVRQVPCACTNAREKRLVLL